MNDEEVKAALTSVCITALHITPLYITLYEDGALIKANTGHEYWIDRDKVSSGEELKQCLTDVYYQHKANNMH